MVSRVRTFSVVEFSFEGKREWELFLWLLMSLILIECLNGLRLMDFVILNI
jgi:hypothetical protein